MAWSHQGSSKRLQRSLANTSWTPSVSAASPKERIWYPVVVATSKTRLRCTVHFTLRSDGLHRLGAAVPRLADIRDRRGGGRSRRRREARPRTCERGNGLERLRPRPVGSRSDDLHHLLLQGINAWIRVTPRPTERAVIELGDRPADVGQLQQRRFSRDEQSNPELDRRDVLHERQALEQIEQIEVSVECRPRSERDERRSQREAG